MHFFQGQTLIASFLNAPKMHNNDKRACVLIMLRN